ncbi:MAG: 23S rRNA (adenine(2503)-C(2))-methyltransferase RlmN [bacterium]|nr:23S rRNA (adenine(2503)-C(2))-methyltransferase RlmN [bacterium]
MKWIYDLSYDQLKEEIEGCGIKKFVADQIFQWLYGKMLPGIELWTNISKKNREMLTRKYDTTLNHIVRVEKDPRGTKKFLFRLKDNYNIESVLIAEKSHYTFCISTQVGCALKCAFCATGKLGFKRNLEPGEILSQIVSLKKELGEYTGKLNLVFMGMGEPLLNYENLKKALDIITAEKGISISPRNITISTAGILAKIRQLEKDFPKMKISFSLNAPDSPLRETLMPISKKEKLDDILAYFRAGAAARKHRITFEYVLLKGVNDTMENARDIAKALRGIPCKINLIPFNPIDGLDFKTPEAKRVETFEQYLHSRDYTVTVRWSKGRDIKSACGQLAAQESNGTAKAERNSND